MAHKKAGGSSRNGRDTAGRRLGIKKSGGQAPLIFAMAMVFVFLVLAACLLAVGALRGRAAT